MCTIHDKNITKNKKPGTLNSTLKKVGIPNKVKSIAKTFTSNIASDFLKEQRNIFILSLNYGLKLSFINVHAYLTSTHPYQPHQLQYHFLLKMLPIPTNPITAESPKAVFPKD